MGRELNILETNTNRLVMKTWDIIKERADYDRLGQEFWGRLNRLAPDQTHIFRRPLKMWGTLLHHIVNMLMVSIEDPESYFNQLFLLTVRHIRYGVRPDYLPPFGRALLETFEFVAEDHWDAATAQAWQQVWKRAADSITRGLNLGGSPLTYALVEGDVESLEKAINVSPRALRAMSLCRIDIEGVIISPLYWALHDGKYNVAEFILKDLLSIRADLHGYYYGREMLFECHADLVCGVSVLV